MRKILFLWFLIIFFSASICFGQDFKGVVATVNDGDTIEVVGPSKVEKIRIVDIDCPEIGQPYGYNAKRVTLSLVQGKEVVVKPVGKDRYGRTLAEVYVDGKSLGEELVKSGAAWWFEKYSSNLKLKTMEVEARQKKVGLWAEANPMSPWDWRHKAAESSKNVESEEDKESEEVESSVGTAAPKTKTIQTGPRGGRYYYDEKGRKVYQKRK